MNLTQLSISKGSLLLFTFFLLLGRNAQVVAQDFEEIFKTNAPRDSVSQNYFGNAVSISGSYAVVGGEFTDNRNGAAYVYMRDETGNWKFVQELIPNTPRSSSSLFGTSVSISGKFILVGAPNDNLNSIGGNSMDNAGSVYFFERNAAGIWEERQKLTASDRTFKCVFGQPVFMEGNTAMIGSRGVDPSGLNPDRAGAVYYFKRNSTTGLWVQKQKITPANNPAYTGFGTYPKSISISGEYVLIGAVRDSTDANGSNRIYDAGSAYLFERNASGTWEEKQKLVASDRDVRMDFARSISISGNSAVIGANYCNTDPDGNNALYQAGAAYVFERNNSGVWEESQKLVASDRSASAFFGISVAIDKYGLIAIGSIGAKTDVMGENPLNAGGAVYLFERNPSDYWSEVQKFVASDRRQFGHFGWVLSISDKTILTSNFLTRESIYLFSKKLDLGVDTTICPGDSILLTSHFSASNHQHLWSNGSTDSFLYAKEEGLYTLKLNFNGQELFDSINLTLRPRPMVYVGPDTAFCGLFEYRIDAKGEKIQHYRWNNGDTQSYTVAEIQGMYYVRVQDEFTCSNADTMEISALPPPAINLSPDTFLCNNATLQLSGGPSDLQYLWSTGASTPSINIQDTGWYSITVTKPFCSAMDSIYVYEFCPPEPLFFIPNVFSPDNNNLNDTFLPYTEEVDAYNISIYNRWGEHIFESSDGISGWDGTYMGEECPGGVYMYIIRYQTSGTQHHTSGSVMLVR